MEWFPHPLKAYKRWLINFPCCGWGYGSVFMPLPPHLLVVIRKVRLVFGHCWVQNDTAVHCGWGSKPTWNGPHIHSKHKKMIDILYMLWMGIWICLRVVTSTLIGPDVGSPLNSLVSDEHQMILSGNGWCSKPTWNGFYFHSRHIKGDWQPSCAFDGDVDVSSCRYHHTCCTWLGRPAGIFGWWWAQNDTAVHCGWGSKPTWNVLYINSKHINGDW